MRIAFIVRSTLYTVPGGDTIQVTETAKSLRELGVIVEVLLTNSSISYPAYDFFHFFNINRPADILYHLNYVKKPFFVTPILVDYSGYDKYHRQGISGAVLRYFSADTNEYIKTLFRWLAGKDVLQSKRYIWKGQKGSICEIMKKASALFPGSEAEARDLKKISTQIKPLYVVPNGIDATLFIPDEKNEKDRKLVICAARIEGIKNQLNLIRAVNDTGYELMLIGAPGPNQRQYFETCKRTASKNVIFKGRLPQEVLIAYYQQAGIHVLPSWFETCGLSSLEAAAMGCNIVITEKGYTREYFGDEAFYCDPGDPESILKAINEASHTATRKSLRERVVREYSWRKAAALILGVYKKYR